jgi:hypothetical protein
MSDVFVSYKREDEARVYPLVTALEQSGLSVWWDRSVPGSVAWRRHIETALDAARSVIVVWTEGSAGPEGAFVHEEASRAMARGVLVPIRLDDVPPPLGFGEIQTIDLTGWRGSARDPSFADLVAVLRARLAGTPPPPAQGQRRRLARRMRAAAASTAAVMAVGAVVLDVLHVQERICRAPLGQPRLSDLCGDLGIGSRPSGEERRAWMGREPGSCQALRDHLEKFPGGAYRDTAFALLANPRRELSDRVVPSTRVISGYVRQSAEPFPTRDAAEADAAARARADAASTGCASVPGVERVTAVDVTPVPDCRRDPRGGFVCAANYRATCHMEARAEIERCD